MCSCDWFFDGDGLKLFRFAFGAGSLSDVFPVPLGDFRRFLVAIVEIITVAPGHTLAGVHLEFAGLLVRQILKLRLAKRICREQSVGAHMPPRRMAGVGGMIEHGYPDRLACNRTKVIAPVGAWAPRGAVVLALARHDLAVAGFGFLLALFLQFLDAHGF